MHGWEWLAGFYEGEGTLHFAQQKYWRVQVQSTDPDTLHVCARIAGGRVSKPRWSERSTKPYSTWLLAEQRAVLHALEQMRPYLLERRGAAADRAIADLHAKLDQPARCRNGHIRTVENTIITPKGHNSCRICENASQRRRWHERKAP